MLEHDVIINACDNKRDRLGLEALSAVERVISLASWADFEIENGGLSQFYYNGAGDDAIEMVWALKQVGAFQASSALEKANALLIESGAYLRDRAQRQQKLKPLSETLESLTDDFYAEHPDVFTKVCDYIDTHEQELRESGVIR